MNSEFVLKFIWFQNVLIRVKCKHIVENTCDRKWSYSSRNRRICSNLIFYHIEIHITDRFAINMSVSDIYNNLSFVITNE